MCLLSRCVGLHMLHDNAPAHSSSMVIEYVEEHEFKTLPNPAYIRSSSSHLVTFASKHACEDIDLKIVTPWIAHSSSV